MNLESLSCLVVMATSTLQLMLEAFQDIQGSKSTIKESRRVQLSGKAKPLTGTVMPPRPHRLGAGNLSPEGGIWYGAEGPMSHS